MFLLSETPLRLLVLLFVVSIDSHRRICFESLRALIAKWTELNWFSMVLHFWDFYDICWKTKPSREVLGFLLPGTQKYPSPIPGFWDNTGTIFWTLGFPRGKLLSEEQTQFPYLHPGRASSWSFHWGVNIWGIHLFFHVAVPGPFSALHGPKASTYLTLVVKRQGP